MSVLLPGTGAGLPARERWVLDEVRAVARLLLPGPVGRFVDVGAHVGKMSELFANAGWQVIAFEPDAENLAGLRRHLGAAPNVVIEPRAVGRASAAEVPFYQSPESTGISSLTPFRDSHVATSHVEVVSLGDYFLANEIREVTFLKVDVEGNDLPVLEGLDWTKVRPGTIVAEYEDAKTVNNGYRLPDLCEHLRARGYTVFVSEWHPIERYGQTHQWRRLHSWPTGAVDAASWGNVVAFLDPPNAADLVAAFSAELYQAPHPKLQALRRFVWRGLRRLGLR